MSWDLRALRSLGGWPSATLTGRLVGALTSLLFVPSALISILAPPSWPGLGKLRVWPWSCALGQVCPHIHVLTICPLPSKTPSPPNCYLPLHRAHHATVALLAPPALRLHFNTQRNFPKYRWADTHHSISSCLYQEGPES